MQDRDPVIDIAIIQTIPLKVTPAVAVLGKAEKKGRTIQSMSRPELGQLLGRRLVAQNCCRRITRDQLNQNGNQGDHCPHYKDQQAGTAQQSKQFASHLGSVRTII